MKKPTTLTAMAATILLLSACSSLALPTQNTSLGTTHPDSQKSTQSQNEQALTLTMQRYQQAMRTADIDGIGSVLHPDVITTFQDRLTTKGKAQVLQNYQNTFAAMDFSTIEYVIDDIMVDGDLAVVATIHPVGSYVTSKKDNRRHLDHNRELFVFKKVQDNWLIYRYMYNQTPEQAH